MVRGVSSYLYLTTSFSDADRVLGIARHQLFPLYFILKGWGQCLTLSALDVRFLLLYMATEGMKGSHLTTVFFFPSTDVIGQ